MEWVIVMGLWLYLKFIVLNLSEERSTVCDGSLLVHRYTICSSKLLRELNVLGSILKIASWPFGSGQA